MGRGTTKPTSTVTDMDGPTKAKPDEAAVRQLFDEVVAVASSIFDLEDEKKAFDKKINDDIAPLKTRLRELVDEIKAGGVQLGINFATKVTAAVEKATGGENGE